MDEHALEDALALVDELLHPFLGLDALEAADLLLLATRRLEDRLVDLVRRR